jgi:formiminotetrahydrofolate cyclodeaminase
LTNTVTWDDSIRTFLQQAGSSHPTPGGGSVAALAAALGASMTLMVSNLSQGEKFAHIRLQIADVIETMRRLTEECEVLLHADMAAFSKYMVAWRLPKETEEEKIFRKKAMEDAVVEAIEVPFRLMEVCRMGVACALRIAETCNRNVVSDLGIGVLLFEAAAQSASLTVEINLGALKDEALIGNYTEKLDAWMSEIAQRKNEVVRIVRERLRRTDSQTSS